MEYGHIEGVAGVNLPMLLRVTCGPADLPLKEIAERALQGGRDCIVSMSTDNEQCVGILKPVRR